MAGKILEVPKRKLLIITKRIKSWSYSRIRDHEQCGYLAGLKHALGLKEPGNAAMSRGSDIGKMAERYVKGEIRVLPRELQNFSEGFKALRTLRKKNPERVVVEESWAFRADWSMTHTKDWDAVKCRVKMDVCSVESITTGPRKIVVQTVVIPIDHKTGKYSPEWNVADYLDQLDLYAMTCLIVYGVLGELPNVVVRPKLWFLDHGIEHPADREYTIADLPALKKAWEARAKRMMDDTKFRPKPSTKCKWCYFRAGNQAEGGGQCIH